ncbi:T9SS type A sorting domain-containing protein [Pontimicrobium sp. SW4]|uniref:T9SS type A sorting domain-containing protein n=1 Tax=Pontimicrobium sp. SW4 TaxID=3153519 RepID=A0AAU7BW98_9FLAO
MKQKLLYLFFSLLISASVSGQVTAGQIDDFEDTTTQGWRIGGAGGASGPTNVATGGPGGTSYLQYVSTGTGTVASKMIIINTDQWIGNYTGQGIKAIRFHVKVETNDLNLRVAFNGDGGRISSTNPLFIAAGSGWQLVEIPVEVGDFSLVSGGSNVAATLLNVYEVRLLSSPTPAWQGETIASTLSLDNITAKTSFLSTKDNKLVNAFSISPNPGRNRLNLKLSKLNSNATIEVFDVLGKRIYANRVNTITKTVDASQWNNGVYLVRLTTDSGTQTKRFVKQ